MSFPINQSVVVDITLRFYNEYHELSNIFMKQQWLANWCEPMRVFSVVTVTQMMVLIYSLSFLQINYEYLNQLSIVSLLAHLIGISLLLLFCKVGRWLNQMRVHYGLMVVVLLIVLVSSVYTQMVGWLDKALGFGMLDNIFLLNIKITVASLITFLSLMRYFYVQTQWQLQVEAASRSQMHALQARIKPHFLYNSMNSIAAMIPIDTQKAEKAVVDLSNLFRRAFSHRSSTISLAEELEWVKQYLDIEKLRFQDRLNYTIEVEGESILSMNLPVLCLQPLVENAIIHGIQHLPKGGYIKINIAYCHNRKVCIEVKNSYEDVSLHEGNGMGIRNIKNRLALMYGVKAKLDIIPNQEDQIFTAMLELPV